MTAARLLGAAVVVLCAHSGARAQEAGPPPRITFLDAERAAEAIADDSADPYFALLQPLEIAAKTGRPAPAGPIERQRAECRRLYHDAALAFTAADMDVVARAVQEIHPFLLRHYPRVTRDGWSFLKLDSHIEGGLAHTRGEHIVLSPALLNTARATRDSGGEKDISPLARVLLHERVHVLERRYPKMFRELYERVWGFRLVESLPSHPWLREHQALNPDGTSGPWVYPVRVGNDTVWVWPTVVIGEPRGIRRLLGVPSLTRDLRFIAVELVPDGEGFALRRTESGQPVFRRLITFGEYRREFPASAVPYHPKEIAAESFTRIVAAEIAGAAPDPSASDPRIRVLRRWFEARFR